MSYGANLARRFSTFMGRSNAPSSDADAKERKKQNRMSTGVLLGNSLPRRGSANTGLSGVDEADSLNDGESESQQATGNATVRRSGTLGNMPMSRANGRTMAESSPSGAASVGRAAGLSMSPASGSSRRSGMPASVSTPLNNVFVSPGMAEAQRDEQQQQSITPSTSTGWFGPTTPGQAEVMPNLTRRRLFGGDGGESAETSSKPIFLKGLFSVQTTSTKPRTVIHASLVKVLDRIGVQYREIRGGYECVHLPSLDFSGSDSLGRGNARIAVDALGNATTSPPVAGETLPGTDDMYREPKRKTSRLSLMPGRNKDKDRAGSVNEGMHSRASSLALANGETLDGRASAQMPPRTASKPSLIMTPRARSDSIGAGSALGPSGSRDSNLLLDAIGADEEGKASVPVSPPSMMVSSKTMNAAQATDLAVRFEIFVVKVPLLLGVNGLQFRRVGGNPWQYHMLAKRILQELKL